METKRLETGAEMLNEYRHLAAQKRGNSILLQGHKEDGWNVQEFLFLGILIVTHVFLSYLSILYS